MTLFGLNSRFFQLGLAIALFLTLIAYGFAGAPEAARRILQPRVEATVPFTCMDGPVAERRLPPPDKFTLPIYPGCELERDYEKRVICGFERLQTFIKQNLEQPDGSARERVIIAVVIDKHTGLMRDPELKKGKDDRNIQQARRVLQLMRERGVRWSPATRQGEPFDITLGLPFSFHGAGCGD